MGAQTKDQRVDLNNTFKDFNQVVDMNMTITPQAQRLPDFDSFLQYTDGKDWKNATMTRFSDDEEEDEMLLPMPSLGGFARGLTAE